MKYNPILSGQVPKFRFTKNLLPLHLSILMMRFHLLLTLENERKGREKPQMPRGRVILMMKNGKQNSMTASPLLPLKSRTGQDCSE